MATPASYPAGKVQLKDGQYSSGLCECCLTEGDCKICLAGWCCLPCLVAHNNANLHGYNCHCCDCCCSCGGNAVSPVYFTRIQLGQIFNFPEDHCRAATCAACCGPCAACQDAREIKYRRNKTWC